MKQCEFQTGIGRLQRETKRLREQWQQAKLDWQDQSAREFEQKFLQPLVPIVKLSLAAIYELDEIVQDADKACGDHGPQ